MAKRYERFDPEIRKIFLMLEGQLRRHIKTEKLPRLDFEHVRGQMIPLEECAESLLAFADIRGAHQGVRAIMGALTDQGYVVIGLPEEEAKIYGKRDEIGQALEDLRKQDPKIPPGPYTRAGGGPEGTVADGEEDREGAHQSAPTQEVRSEDPGILKAHRSTDRPEESLSDR